MPGWLTEFNHLIKVISDGSLHGKYIFSFLLLHFKDVYLFSYCLIYYIEVITDSSC